MSVDSRTLVSIVCPVFNEDQTIPLFYKRLQTVLAPLRQRYDFELIFTNNRSTDDTLDTINSLHQDDPTVQVLTLSRNFGYQASVLAGLSYAQGEGIVVIDVDCEDPPEMIPQFIAEWENGYDVVYGERGKRPEFIGIQWMRKLFYRLNRLIADSEIILDMAEFSLISAHVRDIMLSNRSTFPFLRAEIGYAGFSRKEIPYDRQKRIHGKSNYNLFSMTKFAIGGILSSSTFFLRLAAYVIPFLILLNCVILFWGLKLDYMYTFNILLIIDLLYIAFFISIACIYIARVYKDGTGRPVFIVDWQKSVFNNPPPTSKPASHLRDHSTGTRRPSSLHRS